MTTRSFSSSLSLWLHILNPAIRYKSPAHSSTGTQSGLTSRSPSAACRLLVSCAFHSPPGVLFTFPSRYWFTIGHSVIFSLARWSLRIHTEFHVLRATREIRGSAFSSLVNKIWSYLELQDFHFLRYSIQLFRYRNFQKFYATNP